MLLRNKGDKYHCTYWDYKKKQTKLKVQALMTSKVQEHVSIKESKQTKWNDVQFLWGDGGVELKKNLGTFF